MFVLIKTSWRRTSFSSSRCHGQDEYIGLNLPSWRRLQGIFKTSSRFLQDVLPRRFHKTSSRCIILLNFLTRLWDVYNTFLRLTVRMVIYSRICLGHTSEKFMVSVQNLRGWKKFLRFLIFALLHLLVATFRDVFRTWSNIYNGFFFVKILNGVKLWTIFPKKSSIVDAWLCWK